MASLSSSPELPSAAPVAEPVGLVTRVKAWFKNEPGKPELTLTELKKLADRPPLLVKEMYEIAQRQLQSEAARQGRLDAKATSLLGAVGLSLTVAFTFGGLLLSQAPHFTGASDAHGVPNMTRLHFIAVCFAFAIVSGIGAGAFAIKALGVKKGKYRSVSEDAVFNKGALDYAESRDNPEVGLADYRRFMLVQLWDNARRHGKIHDDKAMDIRWGQHCFVMFLFWLFLICFSVVTTIQW